MHDEHHATRRVPARAPTCDGSARHSTHRRPEIVNVTHRFTFPDHARCHRLLSHDCRSAGDADSDTNCEAGNDSEARHRRKSCRGSCHDHTGLRNAVDRRRCQADDCFSSSQTGKRRADGRKACDCNWCNAHRRQARNGSYCRRGSSARRSRSIHRQGRRASSCWQPRHLQGRHGMDRRPALRSLLAPRRRESLELSAAGSLNRAYVGRPSALD